MSISEFIKLCLIKCILITFHLSEIIELTFCCNSSNSPMLLLSFKTFRQKWPKAKRLCCSSSNCKFVELCLKVFLVIFHQSELIELTLCWNSSNSLKSFFHSRLSNKNGLKPKGNIGVCRLGSSSNCIFRNFLKFSIEVIASN